MRTLLAFYTDIRSGLSRAVRSIVAVLSISGFAWADKFADQPRLCNALKGITILALVWVAAHDGKPTEPAS